MDESHHIPILFYVFAFVALAIFFYNLRLLWTVRVGKEEKYRPTNWLESAHQRPDLWRRAAQGDEQALHLRHGHAFPVGVGLHRALLRHHRGLLCRPWLVRGVPAGQGHTLVCGLERPGRLDAPGRSRHGDLSALRQQARTAAAEWFLGSRKLPRRHRDPSVSRHSGRRRFLGRGRSVGNSEATRRRPSLSSAIRWRRWLRWRPGPRSSAASGGAMPSLHWRSSP